MPRVIGMLLAMTLVGSDMAAQGPAPALVFGVVRDVSGVVIAGAEVWIDGTARRVVSNDSGAFRLEGVTSGHVRVMVRRLGFFPDSKRFLVAAGETRQVTFALEAMLEELDAVLVTAREGSDGRMAEFWARRSAGFGVFITREEIVRQHPSQTLDLFRRVLGIRVVTPNDGGSTRLVSDRAITQATRRRGLPSGGCQMQYYVDGVFMTPGTFTVDFVPPEQLEAIEVYRGPSEVPARFRQRDTACGLVVLWTREPPPRTKPEGSR